MEKPVTGLYFISLASGVMSAACRIGDSAMEELLVLLADCGLLENLPTCPATPDSGSGTQASSGFVCNIASGIYTASTVDDHQALMNHLNRMKRFGLLKKFALQQSSTITEPATPSTSCDAPDTASHPNMARFTAFSRDEIKLELVREIKAKYESGIPLNLPDALKLFCSFKNRKPSGDEISRVKLVSDFLQGPFLHDLTREHFTAYENHHIKRLSPRTIEERIGLVRRIFEILLQKQTYKGINPLANWKPSVTSKDRKAKAAGKIATMERVASVFGSEEFAQFCQLNRAFYLIMMTAIVTGMRITSICRLSSADLLDSFEGTPIIDLNYLDKTVAGKRQIPLPRVLHTALKQYLTDNDAFPIEDRGEEKGCSDAISELYADFLAEHPKFNLSNLNPHALRTSLNNYMGKIKIPFDIRCALVGHKNGHVNSVSYSSPIPVDLVADSLNGLQDRLLIAMKFDQY